jgi:hypothetical protein
MSHGAALSAPLRRIQVVIRGANVVPGRKPEIECNPIDGLGRAFQLKKCTNRRFIQVHLDAPGRECGAELLVSKLRSKAKAAQGKWPAAVQERAFAPWSV